MSKRSVIIKNSPISIEQADSIARAVYDEIISSWNNQEAREQVISFKEKYVCTQTEDNKSI